MFGVKAALVAGPGLTALLRSRLGLRQFHPGDSYPAVETDPEIQRGQKNPSRERKRAVSIALATLPLSVRIPRANIAARSEISRPHVFAAMILVAARKSITRTNRTACFARSFGWTFRMAVESLTARKPQGRRVVLTRRPCRTVCCPRECRGYSPALNFSASDAKVAVRPSIEFRKYSRSACWVAFSVAEIVLPPGN